MTFCSMLPPFRGAFIKELPMTKRANEEFVMGVRVLEPLTSRQDVT